MKAFEVDSRGDLVISKRDLVMIDGAEELRQSIERILTTNTGEWFLNMDFGLDYNEIQGKGKNKESVILAITEAIFQDSRVEDVDIKDISIDKSRRLLVHGTVRSTSGQSIDLGAMEVIQVG